MKDSGDIPSPVSRRNLLKGGAAFAGGAIATRLAPVAAQTAPAQKAAVPPVRPVAPADAALVPGAASEVLGGRAPYETPALAPVGVTTGSTHTPLQALQGTITPSDLHFQRHHNGIPLIDPLLWSLTVHGLVDKPLTLSLADLKRFPSITRQYFIECSGNGRAAYRSPKREMTPQEVDGMTSNSEWTGVPVSTILREAGIRAGTPWVLAEGGDASRMARSVPIEKMMDDALLVYAQNGEPLRQAIGYPVRLLLPGYEGNMCVKWLRRLEATPRATFTRNETAKYTDPLADGSVRYFSFVLDAKSIITSPSYPGRLTAGWWPVSGIAWTGRGRITRVEVSTDSGTTWHDAQLQSADLDRTHIRFVHMWKWDGSATRLMSRATDETGYVQPTLAEYKRVRGPGTDYHFNYVRAWDVAADGAVFYGVNA
ncbi:MAG: sulfite dehydrogenase [Gemmatimonadota bacterium]|nr:sulfite dehydrogenase [Gemmatimonadota bacterium]